MKPLTLTILTILTILTFIWMLAACSGAQMTMTGSIACWTNRCMCHNLDNQHA